MPPRDLRQRERKAELATTLATVAAYVIVQALHIGARAEWWVLVHDVIVRLIGG